MAVVTIEPGHVRPVWAGHPWIYAQAVRRVEGGAGPGDEVDVLDGRGNFLGRGLYSPGSAIAVRLYTRRREQAIDAALFRDRLEKAMALRGRLGLPSSRTDVYRLLYSEGDGWPGLVVDRLGDVLSVQVGTVGVKRRESAILDVIEQVVGPSAIVDRSSQRMAQAEGFEPDCGAVRGDAPTHFDFVERGLRFRIPLQLGQKTGFYADQRPLRGRVEQLADGKTVLDAYCYVGALAISAARGNASRVLAVDSSALALEVAEECAEMNSQRGRIQFRRGDARSVLNEAGRSGGFDLVICDPPKLAPSRGAKRRALGLMRNIAAAGCRATRPGGLLVLSSCSGSISMAELTRAAALGARDTNVSAIVVERLFQGADHPVPAAFPEGLYLRTLIIEVVAS